MTLSTKIFCLIEEFWLSIAHGTVLHHDKKDIGLSLLFYLGFGWENTPSFGLTKLGYIWKHSPGSVVGIWAMTYYHMFLKMKMDFELWVLGLWIQYLKKKNKITTLTTIKKLLTTPLNTRLLPKKMDLNFIFKICVFLKIRCSASTSSVLKASDFIIEMVESNWVVDGCSRTIFSLDCI